MPCIWGPISTLQCHLFEETVDGIDGLLISLAETWPDLECNPTAPNKAISHFYDMEATSFEPDDAESLMYELLKGRLALAALQSYR